MNILSKRPRLLALAIATGAAWPTAAFAEEGGSGHYAPGASASFVDALPGRPGLAVANYFMYYDSSASGTLPIGGQLAFDSRAQAYSDSLMLMYDTNLKLLGGHYVPAVAVTHVYMANCHSSRDWQFKQTAAMTLPTVILKAGWLRCWAARFLLGGVAG